MVNFSRAGEVRFVDGYLAERGVALTRPSAKGDQLDSPKSTNPLTSLFPLPPIQLPPVIALDLLILAQLAPDGAGGVEGGGAE